MKPRNQNVERRIKPNENSTRKFITYSLAVAALGGLLTTAAVGGDYIAGKSRAISPLEEMSNYNPNREYLEGNFQNI